MRRLITTGLGVLIASAAITTAPRPFTRGIASAPAFEPAAPSRASNEFCRNATDLEYFERLLADPANLVGFPNAEEDDPVLKWGYCWWFSRFLRNATYLAIYEPESSPPSAEKAEKLIAQIIDGHEIVWIEGFHNLSEFTRAYHAQFIAQMDDWRRSSIFQLEFLKPVLMDSSTASDQLWQSMANVYQEVEGRKTIAYQFIRYPHLNEGHAWLIYHMELGHNARGDYYDIYFRESTLETNSVTRVYRTDTQLRDENYSEDPVFLAYTDNEDELHKTLATILLFCNPNRAQHNVVNYLYKSMRNAPQFPGKGPGTVTRSTLYSTALSIIHNPDNEVPDAYWTKALPSPLTPQSWRTEMTAPFVPFTTP